MWSMPARRWLLLAERTPLLPGAVQAALRRQEEAAKRLPAVEAPTAPLESLTGLRWPDGTPMFSVARVPKG